MDHKGKSLVLEDVPGLIPWASEWKGLGIEFLKHIERTGVLLHMLDLYRLDDVFQDYLDIRKELELFSDKLKDKEELIVFSKADLLDDEMREHILWEFSKKHPDKKYFIISAATGKGLDDLKDYLVENFMPEVTPVISEKEIQDSVTVFDLTDQWTDPKRVHTEYLWDMKFRASGKRLEQIVRMTDFENGEAVMRVYDVLDKMGVIREIEKKLEKILESENRDNSFFFEWSGDDNISPRIVIWEAVVPLEKLKYKL